MAECAICLGHMAPETAKTLQPCDHRFHTMCIEAWRQKTGRDRFTCPQCRCQSTYVLTPREFEAAQVDADARDVMREKLDKITWNSRRKNTQELLKRVYQSEDAQLRVAAKLRRLGVRLNYFRRAKGDAALTGKDRKMCTTKETSLLLERLKLQKEEARLVADAASVKAQLRTVNGVH